MGVYWRNLEIAAYWGLVARAGMIGVFVIGACVFLWLNGDDEVVEVHILAARISDVRRVTSDGPGRFGGGQVQTTYLHVVLDDGSELTAMLPSNWAARDPIRDPPKEGDSIDVIEEVYASGKRTQVIDLSSLR